MPIDKGTGLGFELSMVVNSVAYLPPFGLDGRKEKGG